MTGACRIEGCEKPAKARGWCGMHYWRWSKHGDPEKLGRPVYDSVCSVDGCDKPRGTLEYCRMHYTRIRRYGSTERKSNLPEVITARFLSKFDMRGDDECWPWIGTILPTGYGQFAAYGKRHAAHRFSYEFFIGPIPAGLHLDHVYAWGCRLKNCVNPAHLEPVTNAENVKRRWRTHAS